MSEKELKYDVPSWLEELLDDARECGDAMFKAEGIRKNPQRYQESEQHRKRFKAYLRRVYFWYEPKFRHRDGGKPEVAKKLDSPQDVWGMDFKNAKKLFREIRDLMEDLGHTKFEKEKHTDEGY